MPRWWITDHFRNERPYAALRNDDYIESQDDAFPFRFKKVALLSSDWGNYADAAMRGASLFEVETLPARR